MMGHDVRLRMSPHDAMVAIYFHGANPLYDIVASIAYGMVGHGTLLGMYVPWMPPP